MNLHLTEQQQLLRETMERLFQAKWLSARVHVAQQEGLDRGLWDKLLACGAITMRVPEAAGGGGMGLFEAGLVAEKAGRYLAPVPLAEALPAARLLAELGGTPAARLRAQMQAGMPLVLAPRPLREGQPELVPAGTPCIVLAMHEAEIIAITIPAMPPATSLTGGQAECILAGAGEAGERMLVARGPLAMRAFGMALEEWKVLKASMLAGLAQRALEMASEYACERRQFGETIGACQGIAHSLADSLADIEGARLLVWRAIRSATRVDSGAGAYVSLAWWWTTQASARAVAGAVHTIHGCGAATENDIHLYYLHCKAWSLQAGDPRCELYAVADRLWGQEAVAPIPHAGKLSVESGSAAAPDAFADEVRQFFRDHMTDARRARTHHQVAIYGGRSEAHRSLIAEQGMDLPRSRS